MSQTQKQKQKFFSTAINQVQNEQQHDSNNKKQQHIQKQLQSITHQLKQQSKQSKQQNNITLKQLLQVFNQYDKKQKGIISLQQCESIIKNFQSISQPNSQQSKLFIYSQHYIVQYYHTLSLPSNENKCTFDQFLFIFNICSNNILKQSIQQQLQFAKNIDQKVVDFMKKKCQKQSNYHEAKKSKQKIQQIRLKQYQRHKNYINLLYTHQYKHVQQQEKQKFILFCKTWDQFMNQYQITANQLINKMNQKHQQQMNEFIIKNKQQLMSKIHFSKNIIQLQVLEKNMVKAQQYQKAQKIKQQIQSQKYLQLVKKQKQDQLKLQTRIQTLRKQQSNTMNTLLQKIQKDRNDQSKQRINDSEKLIIKNKTLITDIRHKQNQSVKKLYQMLHNITIEENRLGLNSERNKNYGKNKGK